MTKNTVPTIANAISDFLFSVKTKASYNIYSAYNQAIDQFLIHLKANFNLSPQSDPITTLRVGWSNSYLEELQAQYSIETEHLYIRAILEFYSFCANQNWITPELSNKLQQIISSKRRPKTHDIPTPPISSIDKILSYASIAPQPPDASDNFRAKLRFLRNKAFILLLANTGLKVSEICSLRRNNLNFDNQSLKFESHIFHIPTSSFHAIKQYLSARSKLDSQFSSQPDTLPLFSRHDKRASSKILSISRWTAGNIISYWVERVLTTEERANLEISNQTITPQMLRHYFVIKTLNKTNSLDETRNLARHSDLTTTKRYLNLLKDIHDV